MKGQKLWVQFIGSEAQGYGVGRVPAGAEANQASDGGGIFDEGGQVSTSRVSLKWNGGQANQESTRPDIASGVNQNGQGCYWAVFESRATLVPNVGHKQVYLRNNCANPNQTELISQLTSDNTIPADSASGNPAISNDGCRVVFESWAVNLGGNEDGPTDRDGDIFMRSRCMTQMTTTRISIHNDTNNNGRRGVDDSVGPAISPDGTVVVFKSRARNMVTGDTNLATDIFVVKP